MIRVDGKVTKQENDGNSEVMPRLRGGEVIRIGAATGANAVDVSRVKREGT